MSYVNRIAAILTRKRATVAITAILLIGCVIALIFALRGRVQDIFTPTGREMRVYFFNSQAGQLQAENLPINTSDFRFASPWENDLNWIHAAFANMQRPPGRNLSSVWPEAVHPIDYVVDERILFLFFNEAYLDMSPLEEALFRTALVLTITAGPYIDEVILRVGDQNRIESSATVFNAPPISSARLANLHTILYFVCESGDGLVREYSIITDANQRETELAALERLIAGPAPEGAVSFIPTETRVRVLRDVDTRSIYIILSGEFSTRFNGSHAQAQLTIQAIVNTALSNSVWDIRQVFFLIDSARESQFHGVQDFDRGFEYDETVMIGFVWEEE